VVVSPSKYRCLSVRGNDDDQLFNGSSSLRQSEEMWEVGRTVWRNASLKSLSLLWRDAVGSGTGAIPFTNWALQLVPTSSCHGRDSRLFSLSFFDLHVHYSDARLLAEIIG